MTRNIAGVAVAAAMLAAGTAVAQDQAALTAKDEGSKTIRVDCSKGQSINAALADKSDVLIVEFSGECYETVVIPRGSVTLRGVSDDAAIVGPGLGAPTPGLFGVSVVGCSNVALESFGTSGWLSGIDVKDGASVALLQIAATANSRGLRVDTGASVTITDSTFESVDRGIQAWSSSTVKFNGTVRANGGAIGVLVSNGSSLIAGASCLLEVNNHSGAGLQLQQGSSALLVGSGTAVRIVASGNPTAIVTLDSTLAASMVELTGNTYGVRALDSSHVTFYGGQISQNLQAGIAVGRGSSALASTARNPLVVEDNHFGVVVDSSAFAYLDSVELADNLETGLLADGAGLEVWRVQATGNGTDAVLTFGARADFGGGNILGTVSCDDTVLVRGDVGCTAAAAAASPSARGLLRGVTRRGVARPLDRASPRSVDVLLP